MKHVEELQTALHVKDSEIAMLRQKGAAQGAEGARECSPSAANSTGAAHAGSAMSVLEQEVQEQKQAVHKIQTQLNAALDRERVLQQHVLQLQREFHLNPTP
jgi:hypothetical protein